MLANFSNLITFSRGSNATVTDASGRLTYAPHNLVTNSQDFDAAAWTKLATTVASNAIAAPDGSITADTVTEAASTTWHAVFTGSPPTIVSGQNYTLSVYLKAGTRRYVQLALGALGAGQQQNFGVVVDTGVTPMQIVSTGNGTSGTYVASSVQDAGSGWYRISVTGSVVYTSGFFSVSGAAGDTYSINPVNNGSGTYSVWGAQLEAVTYQTTPSPYVSTSVANLLGFSEAFDNAAWAKSNSAIVPGAAQNPINNLWNAQKLMENTAAGTHEIRQDVTTLAVPYTFSVYVKAAERTFAMLYHGQTNAGQVVNLTTGALSGNAGLSAPTSANVIAIGNGWYRISMTVTATAASNNFRIYPLSNASSFNYTGDGNSGIYIYGAQLSNSGSLDPYVPTPGAAPSSTAYYGPRFDYDPVTLAAKGILIEEQRTNLVNYSQDMTNATWSPLNGAKATSTVVGPDGVTNLAQFTATVAGGNRLQISGFSVTSGTTYTMSAVMAAGSSAFGGLVAAVSANAGAIFGLTGNGSVVSTVGAGVTATIQKLSATLFRCTMTFTATATGSMNIGWGVSDGSTYGSGIYPSASSGFIYGSFVQLEAGAFATSYIPTVASQVTRTADVASITGSLFSQWYNQSEGTLVMNVVAQNATTMASLSDGSINNRMASTAGTLYHLYVAAGGVEQANIDAGTFPVNTSAKLAFAYAANNFAAVIDNGAVGTDTSGSVPTVNKLSIGMAGDNTAQINGYVRNITYYPTRLTNDQLQAITK